MKSKLCSGLLVLFIAVLSATAAHAADNDMRLVGKEAKVISGAEWVGGEPGLLRFNIRVRDLCSPDSRRARQGRPVHVGDLRHKGVAVESENAVEPVPCSDWRRLLPQDPSSEVLLLADGTSAATALLVQVFGVWTPAGSVEPRTVALEFADGPWVLSADKVMASSADQLTSGAFSLSRIFWSGSVEPTGKALFAVSGDQVKGMHRLVLSPSGTRAEPRPDASHEAAESQASAALAASTVPKHRKKRFSLKAKREGESSGVLHDRKNGTGLMIAAFVAQGISVGMGIPTTVLGDIIGNTWPVHLGTIPFAPMGVHGFALRFGGSDKLERLRWTGIGLLQAAAYSGVMAALSFASTFRAEIMLPLNIATTISYFSASIAFVIAGASSVGAAKRAKHRQVQSQSRRPPARRSHRGFVMPTIAPRPGGLSLGLAGVF